MNARDEIFSRMRAQLGGRPRAAALAAGAPDILPVAAVRSAASLKDLFLAKLAQCQGTHSRVEALDHVPAHVAGLLAERQLGREIVLAREPVLERLDWAGAGLAAGGRIDPLVPAAILSRAAAAVAETGSIVLTTADASTPKHNLLAELHVAVVMENEIVATPEEGWRKATERGVPRGVVFVTGPSRTGDIEMALELGAHGAVGVHVVIVANGIVKA